MGAQSTDRLGHWCMNRRKRHGSEGLVLSIEWENLLLYSQYLIDRSLIRWRMLAMTTPGRSALAPVPILAVGGDKTGA